MSQGPTQDFHLHQTTWKNSSFDVSLDGAPFAQFQAPPMKWEGVFDVNGRRFPIKTKSAFKTSAHVEDEGGTKLADGVAEGIFRWKYTVTAGSETYVVKSTNGVDLGFTIFQGETPVGQAGGERPGASSGFVLLPTPMPLECKLLLLWLFGRSWRSSKDSSGTSSFDNQ